MTEPRHNGERSDLPAPRQRINSDPATVEKGLVSLVLALVELLRQADGTTGDSPCRSRRSQR
jgi:Gas vesicle protein K